VNGPDHFREGEERMRASDYQRQQAGDDGDLTTAMHEAAMAQAHFLAALVACHATHQHPESVAWAKAVES
jgi:hypothetical protein